MRTLAKAMKVLFQSPGHWHKDPPLTPVAKPLWECHKRFQGKLCCVTHLTCRAFESESHNVFLNLARFFPRRNSGIVGVIGGHFTLPSSCLVHLTMFSVSSGILKANIRVTLERAFAPVEGPSVVRGVLGQL